MSQGRLANRGNRLKTRQVYSVLRCWQLLTLPSILFLLLTGELGFAQTTCRVVNGRISNQANKDLDSQIKESSVDLAKKNTFEFCRANMMMRFLNSKNSPPTNCQVSGLKFLEDRVDRFIADDIDPSINLPKYRLYDSWNLAMMSTSRSRNISIQLMYPGTTRYLDKAYFRKTNIVLADREKIMGYFSHWKREPIEEVESMTGIAQKTAACVSIGALGNCLRSLEIIEKMMKPSYISGLAVTNLEGWRRVYESTLLDRGLVLAAANLESIIESRQTPEKNIFAILKSAFLQTKMSEDQAKDATWLTLGLIGTAGANTLQYAQSIEGWPKETSSKGLALGYIANSMTYLDFVNLSRGQAMFSYPTNIRTSCDTGKPYHFWLSAYLARELVLKANIDPKTAMKTTFLAAQGYQIKRSLFMSSGRNGISGVFSRSNFDPVHQIIRADLAYAATGSFFGSYGENSTASKFLNVNQAIVDLLEDSGVLDPILINNSMGTLEAYSRFKRIFSPDSAMKSFPQPN